MHALLYVQCLTNECYFFVCINYLNSSTIMFFALCVIQFNIIVRQLVKISTQTVSVYNGHPVGIYSVECG